MATVNTGEKSRAIEFKGTDTPDSHSAKLLKLEKKRMAAKTRAEKIRYSEKIGVRANYDYIMKLYPKAKLVAAYRGKGVFDLVFFVMKNGKETVLISESKGGLTAKLGSRLFQGARVFQGTFKYNLSIVVAKYNRHVRGKIKNYDKIPDNKFKKLAERIFEALKSNNYENHVSFKKVKKDGTLGKFTFQKVTDYAGRKKNMSYFIRSFEAFVNQKDISKTTLLKYETLLKDYKSYYESQKSVSPALAKQRLKINLAIIKLSGRIPVLSTQHYYERSPVKLPYQAKSRSNALGKGIGFLELFTQVFGLISSIKAHKAIIKRETSYKLVEGKHHLWTYVFLGCPLPSIQLMNADGDIVHENESNDIKYSLLPLDLFLQGSGSFHGVNPIVENGLLDLLTLFKALNQKAKSMTLTQFYEQFLFKFHPDFRWSLQIINFEANFRKVYQQGKFSANWNVRVWTGEKYEYKALNDDNFWLDKIFSKLIKNQKIYLSKQKSKRLKEDTEFWYYTKKGGEFPIVLKKNSRIIETFDDQSRPVVIPVNIDQWIEVSNFGKNIVAPQEQLSGPDSWHQNSKGFCYYG